MKRFISLILIAIILVNIVPFYGRAVENQCEIICFDDGSYLLAELVDYNCRASGTKTGSKKYTYYDSTDVAQWQVVLTGKFSYTGSSATCTSSSISASIYDSSWTVVSKSASKSGNSATGYARIGDTVAGVVVTIVPVNLTLSCDANGNLS